MSKTEIEHVQYVLQDRDEVVARVLVLVSKVVLEEGEEAPPPSPLHMLRGLPLNVVESAFAVYNVTDSTWVKNRQQDTAECPPINEWLKARGWGDVDSLKNANYIVRPRVDEPDVIVGFFVERSEEHALGFHLGWPVKPGFTEIRYEHP